MNCDTNLQYDYFKSNKDVITQYRKNKEDRITTVLTTQSLAIKSLWEHGMKSAAKIWPKSISKLPKNITTFLFATSITSWQMHPTSTNGAIQHHLYVCIVIRIELLVTWLLDVKHR